MEDLAWSGEKREGGGDIIDLLIRACSIQGLYDERIKTMVKTKGNINSHMAQLVEDALERRVRLGRNALKETVQNRGRLGTKRIKLYTRRKMSARRSEQPHKGVIGATRNGISKEIAERFL